MATTDSYLKWAVGLRDLLPQSWPTSLVVVKSLQNPSSRQIALAVPAEVSGEIPVKHVIATMFSILSFRPDIIVVAATGPFLVLFRWLLDWSGYGRKVHLVSGSPGVAYHLIGDPLRSRTSADLLLVASRAEFERLGVALKTLNTKAKLAIATLPFLEGHDPDSSYEGPETLLFAPQPDIPKSLEDRQKVLIELSRLKTKQPELRIVIKLRAIAGEEQTHFEHHPYQKLAQELAGEGLLSLGDLEFEVGTIASFLQNTHATLATVSSTAALEAIAKGNPTHIFSDFGVDDTVATSVFEGSGLIWPIRDYALAKLQKPSHSWLKKNYFHDQSENNWIESIRDLAQLPRKVQPQLIPKNIRKSLLAGEFLRVMFPNPFGRAVIRNLKLLLGKGSL